jgi:hypothetical protein
MVVVEAVVHMSELPRIVQSGTSLVVRKTKALDD